MLAVIWIDWYAYHLARLRALTEHRVLRGKVFGIELVGGCGVHGNLRFRHSERGALPISTLLPDSDWYNSGQLRISAAVWRKLNNLNPSVVLVPGYYNLPALTAAVWARFRRRRAILMSETTRHDHRRVWWKELVKRTLVRTLFDSAIAGGSAHVRYLQELGFEADLIGRSYDVVDNSFYQQATARARAERTSSDAGLPTEYFLFVGRLAPEKNVTGLLESFHEYRRSGGQWSLVLVGDGPSRQELTTYVHENNLAQYVQFAGLKNSVELVDYYAFANCFVLPSIREPWGLVVNEAMAAGLPVIVSDRCGCAEDLVVPGENGAIINPTSNSCLTAELLQMESLGPEELKRMGQRSLERIRNYSPKRGQQRWCDLLKCSVSAQSDPRTGRGDRTWLQVVSHIDPLFGGISASLPFLCEDSVVTGYSNRVAAFCSPTEDPSEIRRRNLGLERFDEGRIQWAFHSRSRERFRKIVRSADGVHIHGIWEHHCAAAGALLRAEKKPYIVSAHGMLERWALRSKRLKKSIYSALIERRNLAGAACLRALTFAEVEDYRNFGLTNPVAVVPNGVTIPDEVSSDEFLEMFPNLRNKRIVLFLGRLHYKKGLDILCKAWSALHHEFADAQLVLAGPDFDNTRARTESLVRELGIARSVTFTGMLKGSLKWSALSAARVFALPSYSEGFSVAILEALGVGLPVVITPHCNFPDIESLGCGWLSQANAPELENVLGCALATDPSKLRRMASAGRSLTRESYSWPAVRRQMSEVYDWIGGGKKPAAVQLF